jgi:hypothetical protein
MDLYDIEKEMTQLLLWIKTMKKQGKDTTQLAHIYRMLEDSLAIRYNMKKRVHYEIESEKIESPYDAADKVFEKLWKEMEERGINIDTLIC